MFQEAFMKYKKFSLSLVLIIGIFSCALTGMKRSRVDETEDIANKKSRKTTVLANKKNKKKGRQKRLDELLLLTTAKGDEHLGTIKMLVKQGANIYTQNACLSTPLHIAALYGHLKLIEYFIEEYNGNINIKNGYGHTPLYEATKNKQFDAITYLINKGARIDNETKKTHEWPLAIEEAVRCGAIQTVALLLQNNEKPSSFKTLYNKRLSSLLQIAVQKGHLDMLMYLIESGANINAKVAEGSTLLHLAVNNTNNHYKRCLEIINYLIEKGVAINAENAEGKTPLDVAISNFFYRSYIKAFDSDSSGNLDSSDSYDSLNSSGSYDSYHSRSDSDDYDSRYQKRKRALKRRKDKKREKKLEANGREVEKATELLRCLISCGANAKNAPEYRAEAPLVAIAYDLQQKNITHADIETIAKNPSDFVPLLVRPSVTKELVKQLKKEKDMVTLQKLVFAFFKQADDSCYNKKAVDRCAEKLEQLLFLSTDENCRNIWAEGRKIAQKEAPLFTQRYTKANTFKSQLLMDLQNNPAVCTVRFNFWS